MRDELVENAWVERECVVGDVRLLGEHHLIRCLRVCREQSPVDVAPVAKVRVVAVLRREGEDVLHL